MDVKAMRLEILKMYPGPKWIEKVARMRDNQIIAVYYSMKKRGQKPVSNEPDIRQATIYDYDEEGRFKTGR